MTSFIYINKLKNKDLKREKINAIYLQLQKLQRTEKMEVIQQKVQKSITNINGQNQKNSIYQNSIKTIQIGDSIQTQQFQQEYIQFINRSSMSMFRSTEMKFFTMHVPKEDTYQVVSNLADHSFVQFIDSVPNAFHRPYTHSLKRCEEVINKLKLLIHRVHKEGIDLPEVPNVQFIFDNHRKYLKEHQMNSLALLDKIQEEVDGKFADIQKLYKGLTDFKQKIDQLQDYKYLLFKAREVFHSKSNSSQIDFNKHTLEQLRLVNISGIIQSKQIERFTKMIFRVTKGNSILYTFNVPVESQRNKDHPRTCFICIVESGNVLLTKIYRICESFGVKKYKLPSNKDEIFQKIKQIQDNITDTKQLHVMTEKNYRESLQSIIKVGQFDVSYFDAYWVILERQYLIFHTLNLMQQSGNIIIGSIWVPTEKIGLLYRLLPSFVSIRETVPPTKPPTHFELNQFTAPFQQIVNTYGIPRYQEVNPALYAIPVFPFLFGVMFGDIGHGGVLLAIGIWLNTSAAAKKMAPPSIYGIRYLVLLMGIFSFYSGWIYNEFFSLPLNVFGTCYTEQHHEQAFRGDETCVYPFGFDPKWFRASNDLNFFNSYKMKFAVIIGVFQMTFAIFLKCLNSVHFKDYLGLIFQWLPQQIFFFCTFGYMCILILYKWTIPWGTQQFPTSQAPSIIGQMIALPLKMGSTEDKPLWDQQNQQRLQYLLLMAAILCIPTMLLFKPIILFFQMPSKKDKKRYDHGSQEELGQKLYDNLDSCEQEMIQKDKDKTRSSKSSIKGKPHDHDQQHDISQIAVHQIIETIEFVLGSISNTASYLRLWALSLAHGQLSKVFLEKTIGGGITSSNILIIVIGMYMFFNITLGVIMGMDSMECFLHALRLQWVEFQGKFYKADGWKFEPLSFATPIQAKVNTSRTFDQ